MPHTFELFLLLSYLTLSSPWTLAQSFDPDLDFTPYSQPVRILLGHGAAVAIAGTDDLNDLYARQAANLQVFKEGLGEIYAPPIVQSSNSDRPFQVMGDTFPDFMTAAMRSCNVQNTNCCDKANSARAETGGVDGVLRPGLVDDDADSSTPSTTSTARTSTASTSTAAAPSVDPAEDQPARLMPAILQPIDDAPAANQSSTFANPGVADETVSRTTSSTSTNSIEVTTVANNVGQGTNGAERETTSAIATPTTSSQGANNEGQGSDDRPSDEQNASVGAGQPPRSTPTSATTTPTQPSGQTLDQSQQPNPASSASTKSSTISSPLPSQLAAQQPDEQQQQGSRRNGTLNAREVEAALAGLIEARQAASPLSVAMCESQMARCNTAVRAAAVQDFGPGGLQNLGPDPNDPDFDLMCEA